MTLFYLAVLTAGLVVVIAWLLKAPPPAEVRPLTPDMVGALIDMLLWQGMDGGELLIKATEPRVVLHVVKYVPKESAPGLRIECRQSDIGHDLIARVDSELSFRGIPHDTDPGIRIDVREDVGQAQFIVVLLCERVLGLKLARDCTGLFNSKVLNVKLPRLTGRRPAEKP